MTNYPTSLLIRYLSKHDPLPKGVVDVAFIRTCQMTHQWASVRAGLRDVVCSRKVDPRMWGPPRKRRLHALLDAAEEHLENIRVRDLPVIEEVACYVYPYVCRGIGGYYYRQPSSIRLAMLREVLPALLSESCVRLHPAGRLYACARPPATFNPVWGDFYDWLINRYCMDPVPEP